MWHSLIRPLEPPGTEGTTTSNHHRCLPAGAALLHHLRSVVARQLAEAIVAVDDGPVHDLSVSQDKVGVCTEAKQGEGRGGEGGGQKKRKKGAKKAANDWRGISLASAKQDENVKSLANC